MCFYGFESFENAGCSLFLSPFPHSLLKRQIIQLYKSAMPPIRASEPNGFLTTLPDPAWVECPRCGGPASVRGLTVVLEYDLWRVKRGLTCLPQILVPSERADAVTHDQVE